VQSGGRHWAVSTLRKPPRLTMSPSRPQTSVEQHPISPHCSGPFTMLACMSSLAICWLHISIGRGPEHLDIRWEPFRGELDGDPVDLARAGELCMVECASSDVVGLIAGDSQLLLHHQAPREQHCLVQPPHCCGHRHDRACADCAAYRYNECAPGPAFGKGTTACKGVPSELPVAG
jgi:hypothetical protein